MKLIRVNQQIVKNLDTLLKRTEKMRDSVKEGDCEHLIYELIDGNRRSPQLDSMVKLLKF